MVSLNLRMLGGAAALLVLLAGCSGQAARFGLPEPASDRAPYIADLWIGAWVASLVIGVFVWGLIGWAVIRYRRKHSDPEVPRQTQYHLPLELLYTLVPFLIIGVLFFYTVRAQDAVLAKENTPDHTVNVIGQKWSWTFNYMEKDNPAIGDNAHEIGTVQRIPDLYLPVGKSVRFNVNSPDVIHSFWIPAFLFKVDVIPGHPNSFDVTPTKLGVFDGKCAELCGTWHSAMLFKVHVVSEEEYNAQVKKLIAAGKTGEVLLPSNAPNTLPTVKPEEKK